jgi:hypothetical protein
MAIGNDAGMCAIARKSLYVWILCYLDIGGAHIDGAVLCFKADGGVDLELGRGECVSPGIGNPVQNGDSTGGLAQAADPCGPCKDVPVGIGKTGIHQVSTRSDGSHLQPAALPLGVGDAGCSALLPAWLAAAPLTQANWPFITVRTVVLLI